jgi:hypothetical protein
MISHADFAQLRLSQFLPDEDFAQLEDWEFLGRVWVGEARGFSEWLCLQDDPQVLRCLSIAFDDFPSTAAMAVLRTLDLPVKQGMPLDQLDALFGPRISEYRFVKDRISCDYFSPLPHRYRLSCTVLNEGGLNYLVIMVPPIGDDD